MNNKDFMNLYKTLGVAFIFILLMSLIFFKVYKYQLNGYAYDITSSVIGSVLEEHPELEEEIIKSLDSSKKFDISKYGINKNNIETLSSYKDNTFLIATTFFCFLLGSLLIISYIYFRYLFEFYDSLQEVSNYIKDVLCNRSVASMKDFREGIFSCIKSDISKIAIELVRNKNNLEKDKKYLEETLSDISHQLKTPLTSMYMINDILLNEKDEKIRHDFALKNK